MNMFFVPQLGSMIATMHGMTTQLWLQADQTGEFYGQSSQFSGDGFSGMNFILHAVPQDKFEQWVSTARQTGPALDAAGYRALLLPSRSRCKASPPGYPGQTGVFSRIKKDPLGIS
jgi:cytochrome o ubiquinol oxidase subunit 2